MTRAKRIDGNQREIVKALRKLGFSVEYTYQIGKGFPDFIIGFGGIFTLPVELKDKGGKLTDDERKFHARYNGYIITAYDLEEILLGVHQFYECVYSDNQQTTGETQTNIALFPETR